MSKILGIIAEYNPFHNGHLYHLMQAKKETDCDYTIAIMSGSFTQRGEPALINKWSRAEAALLNGIDLVIELPTLYAISSAENYADGAIKLLDSLGIIDYLAFGAETSDINILNDFAEVLYKEPKEFKNILAEELKKGISFPKARENALMIYLNDIVKYANVLSSPNNILGIEYLKSLKKLKSSIEPIAIERMGSGHNDLEVSGNIVSATAIRNQVAKGDYSYLSTNMPASSFSILEENIRHGHTVCGLEALNKEIIYTLRKMTIKELKELQDVSEGLENLLKKGANSCNVCSKLINNTLSKRYTQTRIQRILLYSLLDITKKDMQISKKVNPYARILGFNNNGKRLISEIINANPKIEFVSSVKRFIDDCPNKLLKEMLEIDILATDIYTLAFKRDSKSNMDFTQKIVSI